jgi:hypothetical protein
MIMVLASVCVSIGFKADPDPAFYLSADPDPGSQTSEDRSCSDLKTTNS